MAGRGRGRSMNLPAWMTQGGADGTTSGAGLGFGSGSGPPPPPPIAYPAHGASDTGGLSSGQWQGQGQESGVRRLRSTSRDRDGGSAGPIDAPAKTRFRAGAAEADGYKWKSRSELGRTSNFDQLPQPGMDPPLIAMGPHVAAARGHTDKEGHTISKTDRDGGAAGNAHGHARASPYMGSASASSASGAGAGAGAQFDRSPDSRHARRLYVGNLPKHCSDQEVCAFFDAAVSRVTPADCPYYQAGAPGLVLSMKLIPDKNFGFLELASVEMTTACLQLDGAEFVSRSGVRTNVRIKRPNDYRPESVRPGPTPVLNVHLIARVAPEAVMMLPGGGVGGAGAGAGGYGGPAAEKLFIGGIPNNLSEKDFTELLLSVGPVKSFKLVRDPGAALSKGYGFVEFFDEATSQTAIRELHGIEISNKTLTVKPAGADRAAGSTGGAGQAHAQAAYPQAAYPQAAYPQGYPQGYAQPYGSLPQQQQQYAYAPHPSQYGVPQPQMQMQPLYGAGAYGQAQLQAQAAYGSVQAAPMHVPTYGIPAAAPTVGAGAYGSVAHAYGAPMVGAGAVAAAAAAAAGAAGAGAGRVTSVLKLSNMVTTEELADDQEWADIREDVQAECASYGAVLRVLIPRVKDGYPQASEGFIYVGFRDPAGAMAADKALQGKKFAKRIVISEYYDEALFNNGIV